MADIYSNQEDRIQETLNAINNNYLISVSATAKHFNLKSRRV